MPRQPRLVRVDISMIGKDRTGVIARVTQFLFDEGANIESLEEQVSRGMFHMNLQASWPADRLDGAGRKALERRVQAIGREVKMDTRVRFHRGGRRKRMAILVTKEAHCLEGIIKASKSGRLGAKPVVVVSNRRDLKPIADAAGLPFKYVPWTDRDKAEARLLRVLDEYDVDVITLARFMRILSPSLCWRYRNRIINIHPSLLPAFPGAAAYRQAYDRGVRVVGVTAHFVTPDLDQGPIIAQDAVRVKPSDTVDEIKAKGQKLETKVLLEAIRLFVRKDLDVHWGRVWME